MHKILDFCSIETLLIFYSLLILLLGSEYSYRYFIYQKSYLNIQIEVSLVIFLLLFYINFFRGYLKADLLQQDFDLNLYNSLILMGLLVLTLVSLVAHKCYSVYQKVDSFEYICFVFWALLGLIVLMRSNDFLLVYLGLELSSFCFYIFTVFKANSSYATEAGLKYFLLGALSSGFFLFGVLLFYASGATTNYQLLEVLILGLNSFSGEIYIQQLGLVLILLSILFKLSSFPFHFWAIDVYDGGPLSAVLFLTTVPKLCFTILLTKIIFSLGISYILTWQSVLLITGVASIFWSSYAGIKQKRLKRLLAISGVGNIGFVLVALSTGTIQGLCNSFIYLVSYLFTTLLCWLILVGYKQDNKKLITQNIIGLTSFIVKIPVIAYIVGFIFLSFAGIPPLLGFTSKILVLLNTFNTSYFICSGLILIFSFFSSFYYLRVAKIIFFEFNPDPVRNIQFYPSLSWIIVCGFLIFIILSFYPQPLLILSLRIAIDLIAI